MEDRAGYCHPRTQVGVVQDLPAFTTDADSNVSVLIAEIEEPCAHSVHFGGMCVDCGKDMTE